MLPLSPVTSTSDWDRRVFGRRAVQLTGDEIAAAPSALPTWKAKTAPGSSFTQTAADANPYLAMAACLASGLYGIEPPPLPGANITEGPDSTYALPPRPRECRRHNQAVTDWELHRYFDSL